MTNDCERPAALGLKAYRCIHLHAKMTRQFDDEPFIVRVSTNPSRSAPMREREALLGPGQADPPLGFRAYLFSGGSPRVARAEGTFDVPNSLNHLTDGDIVRINPRGGELWVMYRLESHFNSILLNIILSCRNHLPSTALHMLSNGRRCSDLSFCQELARARHPGFMIGVPLYSDIASRHDFVVQAPGAFDETAVKQSVNRRGSLTGEIFRREHEAHLAGGVDESRPLWRAARAEGNSPSPHNRTASAGRALHCAQPSLRTRGVLSLRPPQASR